MKKSISIVLGLLILMSSFGAYALELPASLSAFFLPNESADFTVSLEIQKLSPYGKEMLSAMNLLLPHLSLSADMDQKEGFYSIRVDDQEAISFSQTTKEDKQVFSSPLLPNRTVYSKKDVLNAFFPVENHDESFDFCLGEALDELQKTYPVLEEAISAYAEDKAANYSIKKIGKAKWVRLAKLTKEQSEELYEPICATLFSGLNEAYRKTLSGLIFQKAFTVAIYYTEENGDVISVYMKGNVKHPNGKTYALAFQFSFSGEKTSYKLELGKGKKGGTSVLCNMTEKTDEKNYSCSIDMDSSFRSLDGKTTWKKEYEAELTGNVKGEERFIQGSIEQKDRVEAEKDDISGKKLSFELCSEQSQWKGTANLTLTSQKNTITDVRLNFHPNEINPIEDIETIETQDDSVTITILDDETEEPVHESENSEPTEIPKQNSDFLVGAAPVGMASFTPPSSMESIDLDTIESEDLKLLQEEFCQNMAAQLLVKIFSNIPQKDLILFSDNMNEKDFSNLIQSLFSVR